MPDSLAEFHQRFRDVLEWIGYLLSALGFGLSVLLGVVWKHERRTVDHGARIKVLEDEDNISTIFCEERHDSCASHNESEFGHGVKKFENLEKKIDDNHVDLKGDYKALKGDIGMLIKKLIPDAKSEG